MSEWIRIKVSDFYPNAVGENEYTYVSKEVYDVLTDTFRREYHAQEMQDLRHMIRGGYVEGETEELMAEPGEALEEIVFRRMDMEKLQRAVQSLSDIQRERIFLYFFKGMTTREIADKSGVSQKVVWQSIHTAINFLKKFFV